MISNSFKPVADAPGVFTSEPLASGQSDRIRAMVHGRTAVLTAINDVLTNEGGGGGGGGSGGGARIIASTDAAEIVTTTRAPAL